MSNVLILASDKKSTLRLSESLLCPLIINMQSIRVKICGMTRSEDLLLSDELGADYFGFILYPNSPRCLSLEALDALTLSISKERCICVDVFPELDKIKALQAMGFSKFQIHLPTDYDCFQLDRLAEKIGSENLWLAPRTPDLSNFNTELLSLSRTILIDSFSESSFGGTGQTGNWEAFKNLKKRFPKHEWVLAGGLSPDNIEAALRESGSAHFDFNSGLETAPGIKSADALRQLFQKLSVLDRCPSK